MNTIEEAWVKYTNGHRNVSRHFIFPFEISLELRHSKCTLKIILLKT